MVRFGAQRRARRNRTMSHTPHLSSNDASRSRCSVENIQTVSHSLGGIKMRYHLAPLYCRPWTLNGISPRLIESHYENNYGTALNRLNAISQEIEQLDFSNTSDQSLARLKRDEIVALNSTLLHELYFASLGGDGAFCRAHSRAPSRRTSVRSIAGVRSLSGLRVDWLAVRAGCCSPMFRVTDGSSTRSRRTMIRALREEYLFLPSICTSTRIIWNSARTPAPTSPHSCAISIGQQ